MYGEGNGVPPAALRGGQRALPFGNLLKGFALKNPGSEAALQPRETQNVCSKTAPSIDWKLFLMWFVAVEEK